MPSDKCQQLKEKPVSPSTELSLGGNATELFSQSSLSEKKISRWKGEKLANSRNQEGCTEKNT